MMRHKLTCYAVILLICIVAPLSSYAWSAKGHDIVASVAENHLTPRTKKALKKLMEGKSLVYWAAWLDSASNQDEWRYTKTWHYKNVDADQTYDTAPLNPNGDAITAVRLQIEVLKSPTSTLEERQLAVKIITHVMGDIHQPMHMGHLSDLGGNKWKIKFFGQESKLHSVWDGSIVESAHKWSHTEWQEQIDRASKEYQKEILSGNLDDWGREMTLWAAKVYDYFPEGCRASYDEVFYWTPMIEDFLLRGGLRLAHVLNSIFDPRYKAEI